MKNYYVSVCDIDLSEGLQEKSPPILHRGLIKNPCLTAGAIKDKNL